MEMTLKMKFEPGARGPVFADDVRRAIGNYLAMRYGERLTKFEMVEESGDRRRSPLTRDEILGAINQAMEESRAENPRYAAELLAENLRRMLEPGGDRGEAPKFVLEAVYESASAGQAKSWRILKQEKPTPFMGFPQYRCRVETPSRYVAKTLMEKLESGEVEL